MAITESTPKVIFFDLDGTLIFQTEGSEKCWREVCCRYEAEFKPTSLEQVVGATLEYVNWYWSDPIRHKTGRLDLRKARREIAAGAFQSLGLHAPGLADKVADGVSDIRDAAIALAPEALETLAGLRDMGIRLGMITNGDFKGQRYKIDTFGLEPYFETIQIEGEAGIGKPEEGVYEMALQKMGVAPADAWMVGDDLTWDIQAAQKAGLQAVWLDVDRKGLHPGFRVHPDRIIHSLRELLPHLGMHADPSLHGRLK